MASKLYLIDGSGFIFRAYHALPALTNGSGTPVGAVLGFVNMIVKLMDSHEASHAAVIFDAARQTFRNRIYPEYKAHRPPPPDDLVPQFAIVKEAAKALGLPAIELADFEADDIIATYARLGREAGMEVIIVSSDKDLMQLIGEGVSMYDAMKQKPIGPAEVMEKFGVTPDKVRHVLALMGDSSDNVPGVPGIGPKTAAELITAYGDIEKLLAGTAGIKQAKRRETLEANRDKALLSYELIGLKNDVPPPAPLESFAMREPDKDKLFAFLQHYGLKSVLTRLQQKYGIQDSGVRIQESIPKLSSPESRIPNPAPRNYSIVRDEAALQSWLDDAAKAGYAAFDVETTGLNAQTAELVGFSLCIEPGNACYVPLAHIAEGSSLPDAAPDLFAAAPALAPDQIPLPRALELLRGFLTDPAILKIGHNIKYDMAVMQRYGIALAPVADSMLQAYVLHAGEHGQGMDELAERYLDYKTIRFDEVTGTGRSRLRFDQVAIDKAAEYAAEDADITMRLYRLFQRELEQKKLLGVYETIERPLIPVLERMERRGVKVDKAQLAALSADFAGRMGEYEREIYALAGHSFNIGSPKQLGEVLFDELQLASGKKSSKSGAYTTDSSVLEELAEQGHALPARVLEWRQLAKLKSTYSDALSQQIDPRTGRVHTCYAMAIAATGRLSSTDPNLQNIPIRTPEGKKIRQAFIAEEGNVLFSADYSQIELRLLAHMADIPTLREAFRNGDDIHAITASQMFGVPLSQMDADLRRKAKTINFGIIYGISAHGLAVRLGIPRGEAAAYIERYFAQYPGIRDYMESAKNFAREYGYVQTLFGRRCHVPAILDKNPARRQFSERAAINAPLQGTAADIIKRAMITLDRKLPEQGPVRMLLQVHDELVFELPETLVEQTVPMVKSAMESAASLSVPLTVETGTGLHWGDAH